MNRHHRDRRSTSDNIEQLTANLIASPTNGSQTGWRFPATRRYGDPDDRSALDLELVELSAGVPRLPCAGPHEDPVRADVGDYANICLSSLAYRPRVSRPGGRAPSASLIDPGTGTRLDHDVPFGLETHRPVVITPGGGRVNRPCHSR